MLFYQVPVLGSFFRIRLTTIDHAIGIGSMIALIFPPDIIVACHIQILEDPVGIFVPTKLASVPEVIGTDGCETGCIVLADGIHQSFGNQVSLRFISTLLHLVTDTPHNDRGMIPVTADRRSQIPVAPFIKELMIVLLAFSFLPLVEGFMNHQHTQSVASIKEMLGHLIVGTSDGIVAVSFHQFHFPFFGTVDGGGSQKSVIVMYATPFQLHRLTIQQKAFLSRKRKGADTKRNRYLIILLSV